MFIFKSNHRESGKDRLKRFEIELILYAFKVMPRDNRGAIGKFCGVDKKTVYNRIMKYPELSHLREWVNFHKVRNYHRRDLWKTKKVEEKTV